MLIYTYIFSTENNTYWTAFRYSAFVTHCVLQHETHTTDGLENRLSPDVIVHEERLSLSQSLSEHQYSERNRWVPCWLQSALGHSNEPHAHAPPSTLQLNSVGFLLLRASRCGLCVVGISLTSATAVVGFVQTCGMTECTVSVVRILLCHQERTSLGHRSVAASRPDKLHCTHCLYVLKNCRWIHVTKLFIALIWKLLRSALAFA